MIKETSTGRVMSQRMVRTAIVGAAALIAVLTAGPSAALDIVGHQQMDVGTSPLEATAVSGDGRFLAAGNSDGRVIVVNRESGERIFDAAGHLGMVTHLRFSDSGNVLTSLGTDKSLQVWDLVTRQRRYSLPMSSAASAPPALSQNGSITVVAAEKAVYLWNTERGYGTATFPLRDQSVRLATFMPDNGNLVLLVLADGRLATIDVAKRRLTVDAKAFLPKLRQVLVSPDRHRLLVQAEDGTIHIMRLPERRTTALHGQNGSATVTLAMAPDSRRAAFAEPDGHVSIWNLDTATRIARWQAKDTVPSALALPEDGHPIMLAGKDDILRFLAADTGTLLAGMDLDHPLAAGTALSDGRGLVTASGSTLATWTLSPDGLAAVRKATLARLRASADTATSQMTERGNELRGLAARLDEWITAEGSPEDKSQLAALKGAESSGDMSAIRKIEFKSTMMWQLEHRRRTAIRLIETESLLTGAEFKNFQANVAAISDSATDAEKVLRLMISKRKFIENTEYSDVRFFNAILNPLMLARSKIKAGVVRGLTLGVLNDSGIISTDSRHDDAAIASASSSEAPVGTVTKGAAPPPTGAAPHITTNSLVQGINGAKTTPNPHAYQVSPGNAIIANMPSAFPTPSAETDDPVLQPATGGLPHNALYMRRNNQFGNTRKLSVQELIDKGEFIDQTMIRFDDFVPQNAADIPQPADGQSLRVSYGLTPVPAHEERDEGGSQEERWYLEIALRAADKPPPAAQAKTSPPVNYVFVVDVSGSMEGAKLDQAKLAIRQLLERMRPNDSIGIVSFSSTPSTVVEAMRVKDLDRKAFARAVAGMKAEGGTDLMMGVLYGISEARKNQSIEGISRIFLFSDGEPTSGETGWLRIRQHIVSELRGLTLSTLAFGADAKFEELDRLAGLSGGRYVAVSDAADLDAFFQDDINRRDYLAAMNIQAKITIDPALRIEHFFGHDPITTPALQRAVLEQLTLTKKSVERDLKIAPQKDLIKDHDGLRVFVPDLAFGETYILLLEISSKKGNIPKWFGQSKLNYVDVPERRNKILDSKFEKSGDIPPATITAHGAQMGTSEVLYAAIEHLYKADMATARTLLDQQATNLRSISFSLEASIQPNQIRNIASTLEKMSFLMLNLGKAKSRNDKPGDLQEQTFYALNILGGKANGFIPSNFTPSDQRLP